MYDLDKKLFINISAYGPCFEFFINTFSISIYLTGSHHMTFDFASSGSISLTHVFDADNNIVAVCSSVNNHVMQLHWNNVYVYAYMNVE